MFLQEPAFKKLDEKKKRKKRRKRSKKSTSPAAKTTQNFNIVIPRTQEKGISNVIDAGNSYAIESPKSSLEIYNNKDLALLNPMSNRATENENSKLEKWIMEDEVAV